MSVQINQTPRADVSTTERRWRELITSILSWITSQRTISSNYTATYYDRFIFVNTASSAITITLPKAAGVPGKDYVIKDSAGNASVNNITVDGNGAETIDGSATLTLSTNYISRTIVSNGTGWLII